MKSALSEGLTLCEVWEKERGTGMNVGLLLCRGSQDGQSDII